MSFDEMHLSGPQQDDGPSSAVVAPIRPLFEMGAYEALWRERRTFRAVSDVFKGRVGAVPSDFVAPHRAEQALQEALQVLNVSGVRNFGVRVHGAGDYPSRLRDAKDPVEFLYFQGRWELAYRPSVAIVGTRNPTAAGIARAAKVARLLVREGIVVVSGLAAGIDTAAHRAALDAGGDTIAVIGTRLGTVYPKQNEELQKVISEKQLLISQVPILQYEAQDFRKNRLFFPERNKTMSALTLATIIVEAGETSGTLTQARAAIFQQRKLFLMSNLFERPDLTWPNRFEAQGAVRVREFDDIMRHVGPILESRA